MRNRIAILIGVGLITAFMGFMATRVEMNYKYGGLLPKSDSAYVDYQRFLKTFSEDGNVMVVGTIGEELYTPEKFGAWHELGNDLRAIHGVDSVFSEAHLYELQRDDSLKRLRVMPVIQRLPATQVEMDSLRAHLRSLPFYNGLLYNDSSKASLMMVFVNAKLFDTDARREVVAAVDERVKAFGRDTGMPTHMSGLPWIRVTTTALVKGEMPLFMALSMALCGLLLLLFFRSWRVMWICMGVVGVSVVWSFGAMALLGYHITMLQSVIAPLVIVTGVPNCVF
ncbi:MAG TPA: MMPL family transporter, partial [Flavobacteriales bacterium]|nr:MMPL family transporter [Flavobacteriales bacterium]